MRLKPPVFPFVVFLFLPLYAGCQDNFEYFKTKFDSILVKYPKPLDDADSDGIDDLMEEKNGTNPKVQDTDGDGLDDYVELFKYKTNPLKKDSDEDGLTDSVWSERIEYSYILKIVARVGKPFDVQSMSSFNFDVKIIEKSNDFVIAEYIVYPLIEPYLVPLKPTKTAAFPADYLKVDTLTQLLGEQLQEIRNVVKNAKSDLEKTVLLTGYVYDNYELKDELFSQCEPLMEIAVSDRIVHVHKGWSPGELYMKYDFQTILKLNCIATEMIKHKSRGACGSTATLIAAIFKNAGIPARIRQNYPFVTNKDSSQVALIQNVNSSNGIIDSYRNGMYGDNHFSNEIFLNGHWIDLDNFRLGNKWYKKPYLKSVHFNNWSDVDFANTWKPWINYDKKSPVSLAIRYKAYKTITIEEIYPKY